MERRKSGIVNESKTRGCSVMGCEGGLFKSGYCTEHYEVYNPSAPSNSSVAPEEAKAATAAPEEAKAATAAPKLGGGGSTCFVCTKISFPAETVMFESRPFHVNCFTCTTCSKKIAVTSDASMFEQKVYCKRCFQANGYNRQQAQVKWVPKSGGTSSTVSMGGLGGGGNPCTACNKTCYPAEGVSYEGRLYHSNCLCCSSCTVKCSVSNVNQFEGQLFCAKCWERGGYRQKQRDSSSTWNKGASASGQQPSTTSGQQPSATSLKLGGGGTPCTACNKTCYPAETVSYESKPYHANCLNCNDCGVRCNVNAVNQFQGTLYCTKCWDKNGLARKQREVKWSANEAAEKKTVVIAGLGGGGVSCTVCAKTCYPAETVSYESKPYHTNCLTCSDCSVKCLVSNVSQFEGKLYCSKCWETGGYRKKQRDNVTWTKKEGQVYSSAVLSLGGGGNKCVVCTMTVYPAETLTYEKQIYHIKCFKCSYCGIQANASKCEHKQGRVFCTKCWNELSLWRPDAVLP